jgi:hypothetical protein
VEGERGCRYGAADRVEVFTRMRGGLLGILNVHSFANSYVLFASVHSPTAVAHIYILEFTSYWATSVAAAVSDRFNRARQTG